MDQKAATTALAALAHEKRLAIFRLLVPCGPNGLPAGEIAGAVDISATATSFHLKELERAGLLTATRAGRYVRYAIHIDGMRDLIGFLTEDCCGGRPELCGEACAGASRICTPADGETRE